MKNKTTLYEKINSISYAKTPNKVMLNDSKKVHEFIIDEYKNVKNEVVIAIYVNTKNYIIGYELISIGSINYAIIEPRDLIHSALNKSASGIFLVHNHPSGALDSIGKGFIELGSKLQNGKKKN